VLLPLILLGILLVATGIARWLVYSRRGPARRAAGILNEIRREGLSAHWEPYTEHWFLHRRAGQVMGWSATVRVRFKDGDFGGIDVSVDSRSGVGIWEWWRLSPNATEGQYEAGAIKPRALPWEAPIDVHTTINLEAHRVSVKQLFGEWVPSGAPIPENYLPEGTMELGVWMAGQGRTEARFKFIDNDIPPMGGTTRFLSLLVRGVDPSDAGVPGADSQVNAEILGPGGRIERSYFFDSDGGLLRAVQGDTMRIAAPKEDVTRRFGNASQILETLMQIKNLPISPEEAPGLETFFETETGSLPEGPWAVISGPIRGFASASVRRGGSALAPRGVPDLPSYNSDSDGRDRSRGPSR
jgi:hypothetical protein